MRGVGNGNQAHSTISGRSPTHKHLYQVWVFHLSTPMEAPSAFLRQYGFDDRLPCLAGRRIRGFDGGIGLQGHDDNFSCRGRHLRGGSGFSLVNDVGDSSDSSTL